MIWKCALLILVCASILGLATGSIGVGVALVDLHNNDDTQDTSRLLQILPGVMSSYSVVDWFVQAPDCGPHLLSVDLECLNGKTQVVSTTNATCVSLTSEDWIRCTATDENEVASVQVSCTGDSIQSLTLVAKSVPFSVGCSEISSPRILLAIHRLCPADNDSGWTPQNVTFGCINSSKRTDGVCTANEYILCDIASNEYGIFYACRPFKKDAVFAVVYYSGLDTTCLFDVDDALDSFPNMQPNMQTLPPPTTASTDEGDVKVASYQIYFDTNKNESSSDCIFPAASVLLVCGSGEPPVIQSKTSTICFGIRTRDQVSMTRCFKEKTTAAGNIIATCTGSSEATREIFAYMDEQTLTQCENSTAGQDVANYIWMSALCDGEIVWGENRKCLQATESKISTSDAGIPYDTCISSYNCNATTSCTGERMIVSASADNDSCLEPVAATSLPADSPSQASSTGSAVTGDPSPTGTPTLPNGPTAANSTGAQSGYSTERSLQTGPLFGLMMCLVLY